MKPIESVYVAGKMEDTWRLELFDGRYQPSHSFDTHGAQLGCNPLTVEYVGQSWPESSHATVCGLRYTGPFYVDLLQGHGYAYFEGDEHGGNVSGEAKGHAHDSDLHEKREKVQHQCFQAIAQADLVFAWIDCIDCYGTIAEIGYARALGKIIWIGGPRRYDDLWFVYQMADQSRFASQYAFDQPIELLRGLLDLYLKEYQHLHTHFTSPIEQAFWDEWFSRSLNELYQLEPQYPIGKYRVDFAHPSSMTAIELDGFASHSSTEDIANDRKRQRFIEEMGWHVIRFGGREVHNNVGKCVEEVYRLLEKRTSNKEGAL